MTGGPVLRAECRLCGYAGPFDTEAPTGTVTGDRGDRHGTRARADGDAAGPERGQGPGRRARRLPAAGAAAPHRHRHRPRRAGPHPLRAHPGLGLPALRRTRPDPARHAMPRRLAPRPRTRHRPRPGHRGAAGPGHRPRRGASRPGRPRQRRPRHGRAGRADRRAGRADHRRGDARQRAPGPAAPPPVHQAQAGRRAAAPPPGQHPDGRQDLHRAGRQDLPAVPVRHADLPVLWPGRRGRSTRRPGHLRLHAGPPGTRCTSPRCSTGSSRTCAATVGYDLQYFAAIEPQRGSPRTSTSPSAAPSPAPSSARSSPPPTTRSGGPPPRPSSTTAGTCRSGTSTPAPTSTRTPAKCCRPGTRPSTPSATRTSRCTWPGSVPGSTPRACSPDPGTPAGASATSPST